MPDRKSLLGSSPLRRDGEGKTSGKLQYLDDLPDGGFWHGVTVRSPHARAKIRSLKFDAKAAPEGAVFVTARDIPGANGLQILDDAWPILAEGEVQHVGEAVALVAAPTRAAALRAAQAVTVEYQELDPVLGFAGGDTVDPMYTLSLVEGEADEILAALASGKPRAGTARSSRVDRSDGDGDAHAAHGDADELVFIEGEYFSGHQEHIYIECQGMMARWEDDGSLYITGSLQCPYYVKNALQHVFALKPEQLRVAGRPMGGGFGGKEDYPSLIAAHTALLARAAKQPVKIVYERQEDIVATTKRHPSRTRIQSAVKRDGTLVAARVDFDLDGGAYLGLSPVVLSRGLLHATGAYRLPHAHVEGRVLRTNTTPTGAFRGFGAPQSEFAWERHMDRIARTLGLDPLTLRRRNVLRPGDKLPTGQLMDDSCSAAKVLDRVASLTDFSKRWQKLESEKARTLPFGPGTAAPLRGIGLSLSFHGAGFTGSGEHKMRSPVTARLTPEGKVELLTAATEMGQGAISTLSMLAAEETGLELDDVLMADPDTAVVPDSGPTVASRTSMIVGGTGAKAARGLVDRVLAWKQQQLAEKSLRVEASTVLGSKGAVGNFCAIAREYAEAGNECEFTARNEPPQWQTFDDDTYHGSAYPTYSYSAQVIEVEVDPDTLEVGAKKATVVSEVGKVLHEVQCRGQIEGGVLQAIGWALLEDLKFDGGRILNDRMATYIVPTILDAPEMQVEMMEQPWGGPPFGAKGVGELPMDGPAPAVCAAIENATGIVVDTIPAVPERLLERMEANQS